MTGTLQYNIAGHIVKIDTDCDKAISPLLKGFEHFLSFSEEKPSLRIFIDSDVFNEEIYSADNGFNLLHTFAQGEYTCRFSRKGEALLFTIKNSNGISSISMIMEIEKAIVKCCYNPGLGKFSLPNPDHLKFSLWMAVSLYGIPKLYSPVHSSVVIFDSKAILFLGESGTGKSTHSRIWLENINGSELLNDDSPILHAGGEIPYIYGSPWSGKGMCFRNERYPVAAFVRLRQAPFNKIERLDKIRSFGALYPSFPPALVKDPFFQEKICSVISKTMSKVPVFMLSCLPDKDAAEVVKDTVFNLKGRDEDYTKS